MSFCIKEKLTRRDIAYTEYPATDSFVSKISHSLFILIRLTNQIKFVIEIQLLDLNIIYWMLDPYENLTNDRYVVKNQLFIVVPCDRLNENIKCTRFFEILEQRKNPSGV